MRKVENRVGRVHCVSDFIAIRRELFIDVSLMTFQRISLWNKEIGKKHTSIFQPLLWNEILHLIYLHSFQIKDNLRKNIFLSKHFFFLLSFWVPWQMKGHRVRFGGFVVFLHGQQHIELVLYTFLHAGNCRLLYVSRWELKNAKIQISSN